MAVKPWFDYATYMTNKLAQLKALDSSWNEAKMNAAFEKAGFVGDEGAQAHFLKYGHKEDVSPNKYFDAEYYYKAKALQFFTSEAGGSVAEETVKAQLDDYATRVEGIIKAAGMDAWTHYIKYGTAEGINPSNDFDTSNYMAAKLAALQKAEPEKNWDEASMNAAFKKAGLNALEHFMTYGGKGDNEVPESLKPDGSIPSAYEVPEEERIDGSGAQTELFFTSGDDRLVGTNGDDVFTGTTAQVHAVDSVDGKEGNDTVDVWGSTSQTELGAFQIPQMANVENYVMHNVAGWTASRDFTSVPVQTIGIDTMTVGTNAEVTLKTSDTQSVLLKDVKGSVPQGQGTGSAAVPGTMSAIKLDGASEVIVDNVTEKGDAGIALDVAGKSVSEFTVTGQNNASTFHLTNSGNKLSTFKAGGDQALNVATDIDNLKTVDASGMTEGGLSFDISEVSAVDASFAFTGSDFNDKLTMTGESLVAVKGASQDGGKGTDTIAVKVDDAAYGPAGSGSSASAATAAAALLKAISGVKNFEIAQFENADAAGFDFSTAAKLSSFDEVIFKAGTGGMAVNVASKAASVSAWTLDATSNQFGEVTLVEADKMKASIDLTIKGGTGSADVAALSLSGYKTINVTTTGADSVEITNLAVDREGTMVLDEAGDRAFTAALTVGGSDSAVKFEFDGSNFAEKIALNAETWTTAVFTGGTGADEFSVKANLAGAGTGSGAAPGASAGYSISIDGGSGKDTITLDNTGASATAAGVYVTYVIEGYSKGTDRINLEAGATKAISKIDWEALKDVESLDELAGSEFSASAGYHGFILDSNAYILVATTAVAAGLGANEGYLIELSGVKSSDDVAKGDFFENPA